VFLKERCAGEHVGLVIPTFSRCKREHPRFVYLHIPRKRSNVFLQEHWKRFCTQIHLVAQQFTIARPGERHYAGA